MSAISAGPWYGFAVGALVFVLLIGGAYLSDKLDN